MASWTTINIVYSILAVELVLAWNNFQDVYEVNSTGQFIPLFIGLTALVKAAVTALIAHNILGEKVWERAETGNYAHSLTGAPRRVYDQARETFCEIHVLGQPEYPYSLPCGDSSSKK